MTKPQIAPEPSMEDILASIRKMISEDRLGPRPVPDQIARASLGDRPSAAPSGKSANWDAKSEAADASARNEADAASTASTPKPARTASDRPVTSFSSLSDALKSASPTPERRVLDDKIADMLEDEKAPAPKGRSAAPTASTAASPSPLAVFAATRKAPPAAPAKPEARGDVNALAQGRPAARETTERTQPATRTASTAQAPLKKLAEATRAHQVPTTTGAAANSTAVNGAAHQSSNGAKGPSTGSPSAPDAARRSESAPTIARSAPSRAEPHTSPAPTAPAAAKPAAGPEPAEPRTETQRIITMPARFPTASAPATAAGASNGAAVNGARGSMLGLRPAAAPPAPASDVAVKTSDATENAEPPSASLAAREEPEAGSETIAATEDAPTSALDAKEPGEALRALKEATSLAVEPPAIALPAAAAEAAGAGAAVEPSVTEPTVTEPPVIAPTAVEPAVAKPAISKPMTMSGPSESLVDAVMDLVHAEPSALSVFASGSAFIHGVGSHASASHEAEAHALQSHPVGADKPAGTQKLDGTAAELLRPMLRQWLAENMTRIVEEALRSELQSSQGAVDDPDKP